jgi:hypothetical protein
VEEKTYNTRNIRTTQITVKMIWKNLAPKAIL